MEDGKIPIAGLDMPVMGSRNSDSPVETGFRHGVSSSGTQSKRITSMPNPVVKVEHVNPFVTSTMETFAKMLGVEAKPGKIHLKNGSGADYDITGLIGLSGGAKGMVSLSFPKASALRITNKFVGMDHKEIHKDTVDAIGELANIVAGAAKKDLAQYNITISLPTVVTGDNHDLAGSKEVRPMFVPFETPFGKFNLVVGFKSEA